MQSNAEALLMWLDTFLYELDLSPQSSVLGPVRTSTLEMLIADHCLSYYHPLNHDLVLQFKDTPDVLKFLLFSMSVTSQLPRNSLVSLI